MVVSTWLAAQNAQLTIRGVVTDQSTGENLPYVHVALKGKSYGTITNTDGRFSFSLPIELKQEEVLFTFMGYETFSLSLAKIDGENQEFKIRLKPAVFELQGIEVTPLEPSEVMQKVAERIPENYQLDPYLMKGFYREAAYLRKDYLQELAISEGVLEIAKEKLGKRYLSDEFDKVRIIKGYNQVSAKVIWVNDRAYPMPNFTQGAYLPVFLDIIRSDEFMFHDNLLKHYQFNSLGRDHYAGKTMMVIGFGPKGKTKQAYFQGKLYVDLNSYAIVKAEYTLSQASIERFHIAQPKLDITKRKYIINYREFKGRWYLQDAHLMTQVYDKDSGQTFEAIMDYVATELEFRNWTRAEEAQSVEINTNFTSLLYAAPPDFFKGFNILERAGLKENN
jgi:CarboxypepD_reg-like domain